MGLIFVETYKKGDHNKARPLPGQKFSNGNPVRSDWNIQCGRDIREMYPEGTIFATPNLCQGGGGFYRCVTLMPVKSGAIVHDLGLKDELNKMLSGQAAQHGKPFDEMKDMFDAMDKGIVIYKTVQGSEVTCTTCEDTLRFLEKGDVENIARLRAGRKGLFERNGNPFEAYIIDGYVESPGFKIISSGVITSWQTVQG